MNTSERVVISLGGSLIAPDDVDVAFLSAFRTLVLSFVDKGYSFAIATGGGKTCRRYQAAGKEIAGLSKEDVDWVGININNMHAQYLRILFGEKAVPEIAVGFDAPLHETHPILMVGSERPGHSSDYDAVKVAEVFGAKKIINLSNIAYVYDKDPKQHPDAKKIEYISWADFRTLLPEKWEPGLSSPFDPIAAKEAERMGIEVAIISGANLEELVHYLKGEPFVGTRIT